MPKEDLFSFYASAVTICWAYSSALHIERKKTDAEKLIKDFLKNTIKELFSRYDNLTQISYLGVEQETGADEHLFGNTDFVEVAEISALPKCKSLEFLT